MNNKHGYTMIELVVVMAFISTIIFSAMYVPNGIIQMNDEYQEFSNTVKDSYALRTTLSKDILSEKVQKISENELKVGAQTYVFSDTAVRRNGLKITNDGFNFSIENGILKVFNDEVNLEYYISTSMGGVLNE